MINVIMSGIQGIERAHALTARPCQ
eukprot:SAG11_NODE_18462_length_490_cov_1.076726_1_plen_24_part_10